MARTKLVVLAEQGSARLEFEGEGLSWATGSTEWTGFDTLTLVTNENESLVLHAAPLGGAVPHGAVTGMRRESRLAVHSQGALGPAGAPERRRLVQGSPLRVSFYWRNPLSPCGEGLWLHLQFRMKNGVLSIAGGKVPGESASDPGTRLWYATKRRPGREDWTGKEDLLLPDPEADGGYLPFGVFGSRTIRYLDGELPGPLVDGRAGDSWLVDLRSVKCSYTLGPREEDGPPAQALSAGLLRSHAPGRPLRVNSAAFAAAGETLRIVQLISDAAELRCVGRSGVPGGEEWLVDWTIPAAEQHGRADALSLPAVWRHIASHYTLGLSATRSRNRFSAVPTRISGPSGASATLRFEVTTEGALDVTRARLRHVLVGTNAPLTIRMGGAQNADGAAPALEVLGSDLGTNGLQEAAASDAADFAPELLRFSAVPAAGGAVPAEEAPPLIDWILGGARVSAGAFNAGQIAVTLEERGELVEQQPLGCFVELQFRKATLLPASQDPEPGFEIASAWLDRPRPIAIDLADSPERPLNLMIRETASAEASRILRVQTRNASTTQGLDFSSDVVVIDPAPFTVCRVQDKLALEKDALLAEYTDDSESPPAWEFSTGTGDMTIVLPPQAVGEEMIKGRLHLREAGSGALEVPEPAKLFDYRLGANAALSVDRTDIDTARTAPPWMLRRHLNRRIGVTGLKLNSASFELVYGLTTTIATQGLRLAELDALIGRIPLADALVVRLARTRERDLRTRGASPQAQQAETPETVQQAFAAAQGRWIVDLLNRPSWWPLFRDIGDRRQLKLSEDVSLSIRPARQTAHPFAIHDYANPAGEADAGGRRPLRGGADWLFQSPNIYAEFTDAPDSVEALVEGVAFGPLGGEGSQSAHFANGKTIVISKTRQGHLESLVLMRIGRIGMLWNHARHVIIYQRTSRRPPRYGYWNADGTPADEDPPLAADTYDHQSRAFEGFMALRKVREYVEITQPRRRYPDLRVERPLTGPCLQSTFETTVIPVKASWATDIENGQIIPLFGPVNKGEARFFPRPRIFLEFARAAEKGGGLVASEVADPSQLVFFTSTRPQDGRDTDAWPAWPEVDYPLIDQAEPPPVDYRPNFAGARGQPDAARADFGQGRFTIDLVPNEEAINLMHGRQPNAVEARVMNVSLARGRPRITLPETSLRQQVGGQFAKAEALVGDRLGELRAFARSHAASGVATGSPEHEQFIRDAGILVGKMAAVIKGDLGEKLRTEIGSDANRFSQTGDWVQRQEKAALAYADNFAREMEAAATSVEALRTVVAGAGLEDARSRAIAAYEGLIQGAQRRLETFSAVPLQALQQLRRTVDELQADAADFLKAGQARLFALLDEVEGAYRENAGSAAAIDARWRSGASEAVALLRKLSRDAGAAVEARLGPLFAAGGATSVHSELVVVLTEALPRRLEEIEYRLDEIPPFDLGTPKWEELRAIAGLLWVEDADRKWLAEAFANPLKKLEETAGELAKTVETRLTAARKQIADAAEAALEKLREGTLEVIEEQLKHAAAQFEGWASTGAGALTEGIAGALKDAAGATALRDLAGEFDAVGRFVELLDAPDNPLTALQAALAGGSPAEIAGKIEAAGRQLGDEFRRAARHAERAIVKDIETIAGDLLNEGAAPVLELGRALASGLETDTLRATRDALGYYYREGQAELAVTRASAIFNDLGAGNLNALSAVVPFERLRDRLMPELADLDLSKIFPDFAGLKLEHLFPELRIVKDKLGEYDWLTIRHGFDKDRLTAWSDISIDKQFEDSPTLFAIPPVTLTLVNARLTAQCRMEAGRDGQRVQDISGAIFADWALNLSGKPVVTMRRAQLVFGNDGKFDFKFEAENIELAQELKFITEALKNMLPQDEGLTITPALPAGIKAELALPLPDMGTGAFTLTGITLATHLGLSVERGFKVTTGFWLSRPDRPFGLAVLFLGGGGWAGVDVSYSPPGVFETRVSIGVSAGAFVALNLGFARASAGLLFTAGIDFYRRSDGGGGTTAISLGLLIWGDFSILSIAHAYLRITARITYTTGGGMVAHGRVEVKIRISFFYTLRVRRDFRRVFQKGSGSRAAGAVAPAAALVAPAGPQPRAAIEHHFATLDLGTP